jgi:hypothetical protein
MDSIYIKHPLISLNQTHKKKKKFQCVKAAKKCILNVKAHNRRKVTFV